MAASWSRNQVDADGRACDLIVVYRTEAGELVMAPPGTDFIAAGAVFISGVANPDFALALGTMVNKREPLVLADDAIEATDTGADTLTLTAHEYQTGDGPIRNDITIGNLLAATDYWIRKVDADKISLYPTLADAYADTNKLNLNLDATGNTLSDTASTKRGVWGHFTYTATQAETDHGFPETVVIVDGEVDGLDFLRMNSAGAYTTVTMASGADSVLDTVLENGLTVSDALRIILRSLAAKFSKSGSVWQFRDMADTKDSHHGTVTSAGRIDADIDDAT